MVENREVPTDIPTSNKMYEMWLETIGDKRGVRQNEKHDLVPHDTVLVHAEDMSETGDVDTTPGRPGRRLKSTVNSDEAIINRLEEPYPTDCYNHGNLAKITQKYYMCKSLKTSNHTQMQSEPFRVDAETYQMLHTNYSDQYSCYTQNVENNVCVCPSGAVDYECSNELYTRCYLNVTNPPLYQGCSNNTDSFYYMYSIPGFSPCFFYNFSSSIDVEFEVHC